jgi:hypothetical protein
MGYHGRPIEKPKTPGALRVWELDSIFGDAEAAWRGLAHAMGKGYSLAWGKQQTLLNAVKESIQHDIERANFILGILTAGVAGGLMGPIMTGAFAVAKGVEQSLARKMTASLVTSLTSEGAKRTATRYLNESVSFGKDAFSPVGPDPTTYGEGMQENVSTLFMMLRRVIAGIIKELEDGNRPLADGEEYYRGFMNHPAVAAFPDDRDIDDDEIEKNAGLALWITWGSRRDFPYWDKIWIAATRQSDNQYIIMLREAAIHEIARFDDILVEIARLSGAALVAAAVRLDGDWHLDIRKLKDLGKYTQDDSLKAMSEYFDRPHKPMGFSESLQLAMTLGDKMGDKAFKKLDAATQ